MQRQSESRLKDWISVHRSGPVRGIQLVIQKAEEGLEKNSKLS